MIDEHRARYTFAFPYIKGKTVADLACGTGYGCSMMAEAGAHSVMGIDKSTEAIAYAQKHYSHDLCRYSTNEITQTAIATQSIDIVTSFETIEHIADAPRFIAEIHRILKPDGLCIISTPNSEFSVGTNPYHVREYTRAQCEDLLKHFSSLEFFGQRRVYRPLFNLMKLVPPITSFRPWESIAIKKLTNKSDTDYAYFIIIGRP